jgi:hypothetical protein
MLKLEPGKSYVWLYLNCLPVLVAGFVFAFWLGDFRWGILALPVYVAYIVACEVRSGVALDSWGKADYVRGGWQYRALVAWHSCALVGFVVASYFFIRGF